MEEPKILVIGGDRLRYHEFSIIGPLYKQLLTESGFNVTLTEDVSFFHAEKIRPFNVILCCSLNPVMTGRQAEGLLQAVIRGIGFIGVHGACASFLNKTDYLKMIGGRFLTHPPIGEPFTVHVSKPDHPVMKEIADFEITDELYLMETYPPFETMLETEYKGFSRPLAWAKPYGLGRVFYTALGHGPGQMQNPFFKRIITNAAFWCANI